MSAKLFCDMCEREISELIKIVYNISAQSNASNVANWKREVCRSCADKVYFLVTPKEGKKE